MNHIQIINKQSKTFNPSIFTGFKELSCSTSPLHNQPSQKLGHFMQGYHRMIAQVMAAKVIEIGMKLLSVVIFIITVIQSLKVIRLYVFECNSLLKAFFIKTARQSSNPWIILK